MQATPFSDPFLGRRLQAITSSMSQGCIESLTQPTNSATLYVGKWKVLILVMLLVSIPALLGMLLCTVSERPLTSIPLEVLVVIVLLLVIVPCLFAWVIRHLVRRVRQPGLVVGRGGIEDHWQGLARVTWDNVVEVFVVPSLVGKCLFIRVTDPDAVMAPLPSWRRNWVGSTIQISTLMYTERVDTIAGIIRHFWEEYTQERERVHVIWLPHAEPWTPVPTLPWPQGWSVSEFPKLLTRDWFLLALLMATVGMVEKFGLDDRVGMLIVGVLFGLSDVGHYRISQEEASRMGGGRRVVSFVLIPFGVLWLATALILFARGEHLLK